jgi:hypothetical protein
MGFGWNFHPLSRLAFSEIAANNKISAIAEQSSGELRLIGQLGGLL